MCLVTGQKSGLVMLPCCFSLTNNLGGLLNKLACTAALEVAFTGCCCVSRALWDSGDAKNQSTEW